MEITIQNRQRRHRVGLPGLRRFLQTVAAHRPPRNGDAMAVRLVSDRSMRTFNREFRGRDETTDVLAFPGDGRPGPDGRHYLGDIVVSSQAAARQARSLGHSLAREIRILMIHGYLHLLGFDHETDTGQMKRLQARLVKRFLQDTGIRRAGR